MLNDAFPKFDTVLCGSGGEEGGRTPGSYYKIIHSEYCVIAITDVVEIIH